MYYVVNCNEFKTAVIYNINPSTMKCSTWESVFMVISALFSLRTIIIFQALQGAAGNIELRCGGTIGIKTSFT